MLSQRTIKYEDFLKEPKRKYIVGFDDKEDVIFSYREGTNKTELRIIYYPWYFCILGKDATSNSKLLKKLLTARKIQRFEKDGKYIKIFCRNVNRRVLDEKTYVLRELAEANIQTYEADLTSAQRFLVDHQLEIEDTYRILYFDIETDDRGAGIVIGRDRIISIAAVNEKGKVYYWTDNEEKLILKKFLKTMEQYDLITGWNSEKFDVPYIKERCKVYGIWFNWRRILHVDMMQKMMEIHKRNIALIKEVRSFALNAIAKHFLGEEKVEHDMGTWDMFEKDPELLKKYNIQDVNLLLRLDEKIKIIKQKVVEHGITGCFLNEYAISRILDVFVLKNAKKFGNVRYKSKPSRENVDFESRKSAYVGGIVLDQITGIHENVYHFDFSSLYPSIFRTFNISPETNMGRRQEGQNNPGEIYSPNNQVYSDKQGIIPKLITGLLDARNDIRHRRMKGLDKDSLEYERLYFEQYAFKTMANSFYGVLGASFTRYYLLENAEAITKTGHYLIHLISEWFEANGLTVLYGDTDSVFVSGKKIDEEAVHQEINQFIAYHLHKRFNVVESHIDLKVEAVYKKLLLWGKKKKYIKVMQDNTLELKGVEANRRECLPFAAKCQIKMFDNLLVKEKDIDWFINWIQNLRTYVQEKLIKEDVTLQIRLSKHIDDYQKKVKDQFGNVTDLKPSKLAHVKVGNYLRDENILENGYNSWEKGCYVKYIVTQGYGGIEAASIYNYEEGSYDPVYYWNVKVYAMLQRILEVVYPDHDWDQYMLDKPKRKRVSKKQITIDSAIEEARKDEISEMKKTVPRRR